LYWVISNFGKWGDAAKIVDAISASGVAETIQPYGGVQNLECSFRSGPGLIRLTTLSCTALQDTAITILRSTEESENGTQSNACGYILSMFIKILLKVAKLYTAQLACIVYKLLTANTARAI
jgi:hypothetical protein